MRTKTKANIAMVKLLKDMIYIEGKDKEYLLANITRVTQENGKTRWQKLKNNLQLPNNNATIFLIFSFSYRMVDGRLDQATIHVASIQWNIWFIGLMLVCYVFTSWYDFLEQRKQRLPENPSYSKILHKPELI